ncbi:MAG: DUF416 family protein [Vicinamibacteria bacterium]
MSGIDSRTELASAIDGMPLVHQMAFAAACCERLLPNYRAFSEKENWGDWGALRTALDAVWRVIDGDTLAGAAIAHMRKAVSAATPTPGSSYSSSHTSAALDASAAVLELLSMCADGSAEHAIEVGALAREGIFMYLDARNPSDSASSHEDYDNHPLMRREAARQKADLDALRQHTPPTALRTSRTSGTLSD